MTISKYARNESFGDEMFAGMDEFLKAEFPDAKDPLKKQASLEPAQSTAFSDVVEALVTTAGLLDELEHPRAEQAYRILAFIETDMLGLKKADGSNQEA